MNFAILTESKYVETTLLNVQQIQKYHPGSEIHVGNAGLTEIHRAKFQGCKIYDLPQGGSVMEKMLWKPKFILLLEMPVIFMDADSVLIKPFNVECEGDMTVTTRVSRHGTVNSGVFIANNRELIESWVEISQKMADKTGDYLSEQNALNWMYNNTDYDFHQVPCDMYNYPKIEKGIPDGVVVAHLKSGRYKKPELVQIVRDKCST